MYPPLLPGHQGGGGGETPPHPHSTAHHITLTDALNFHSFPLKLPIPTKPAQRKATSTNIQYRIPHPSAPLPLPTTEDSSRASYLLWCRVGGGVVDGRRSITPRPPSSLPVSILESKPASTIQVQPEVPAPALCPSPQPFWPPSCKVPLPLQWQVARASPSALSINKSPRASCRSSSSPSLGLFQERTPGVRRASMSIPLLLLLFFPPFPSPLVCMNECRACVHEYDRGSDDMHLSPHHLCAPPIDPPTQSAPGGSQVGQGQDVD